jgi:hypothetical protein
MMRYSSPLSLTSGLVYLPKRNHVAHLDIEGNARAVVVHLAIAGCDDRAPLRLLFGRVRDDDPADVLLAFFEAPNNEPIV